MKRTIAGVIAGLVSWVVLVAAGGMVIRASWSGYAAVADAMNFTFPMMVVRLALGAVALLAAARLAATIAPRTKATLALGLVLLIAFIPIHVRLWDKFPVWYHLTFLVTLVPLSLLGGKLGRRAGGSGAAPTRLTVDS